MSPLANLLTRGKEETDASVDVSDLTASRIDVVARVNLLPPEIGERERFRREQIVRGGVVVATIAAMMFVTVSAMSGATSAQAEADAAASRSVDLNKQVRALNDVPQTASELAAAEAQRTAALGSEVRWSEYLTNLGLLFPAGTQIESMDVSQVAESGAAGAASSGAVSVVGTPGIGTVTFTGKSRSNGQVAVLLDALAQQKANVDPYFTTATKAVDTESEREVVSFNASVTVTDEAKSGRYTNGGK